MGTGGHGATDGAVHEALALIGALNLPALPVVLPPQGAGHIRHLLAMAGPADLAEHAGIQLLQGGGVALAAEGALQLWVLLLGQRQHAGRDSGRPQERSPSILKKKREREGEGEELLKKQM